MAFAATLQQLNELAIQREDLAENLNAQIVCELTRYTQELKTERKSVSAHAHTHTLVKSSGFIVTVVQYTVKQLPHHSTHCSVCTHVDDHVTCVCDFHQKVQTN